MQFSVSATIVTLAVLVGAVTGETHTVVLINRCGFGTPYLIKGEDILSNGTAEYVSDGPLTATIAYLQIGASMPTTNSLGRQTNMLPRPDDEQCGFNGENCTLLQTALINLAPDNVGSLTDISLIPPHEFSVTTGFRYFNGCDGKGSDCHGPDCRAAKEPVPCPEDDVNLAVIFCGGDLE